MQIARLTTKAEAGSKTVDATSSQIKGLTDELNKIKQENVELKFEIQRKDKDIEGIKGKHQQALSASGELAQQYQQEVRKTHELLNVKKTQTAELSNHNQSLRAELDRLNELRQGGGSNDGIPNPRISGVYGSTGSFNTSDSDH